MAAQLIYASYLNTVAYDAALEGVGVASLADGTDDAAVSRAKQVTHSLSGVAIQDIAVSHEVDKGQALSALTIRLESPVLGFGLIPVTQTAEAADEPR